MFADDRMNYLSFILFISMIQIVFSAISDEYPDIRVCYNKHKELPMIDENQRYYQWKELYGNNCTYLSGNLIMRDVHPFKNGSIPDLSFLESIREVSGFVMFYQVTVPRIPLINLRVIRGNEGNSMVISTFISSLLIIQPKSGTKLTIFDLRNLRSIMRHNVLMRFNTASKCHFPYTVNWAELLEDPVNQKVKEDNNIMSTEPCQRACSAKCKSYNGERFCWGPEANQCQVFTKCRKTPFCKRCYTPDLPADAPAGTPEPAEQCCNDRCAGGCLIGNSPGHCEACQNVLNGKECSDNCPRDFKVENGKRVKNPDFRYLFGNVCVKDCPEGLLREEDTCVQECSRKNFFPNGTSCERCEGGICPKACHIDDMMPAHRDSFLFLNAENLPRFVNCTILTGSLIISDETFREKVPGHPTHKIISNVKDLWALHTLQEVSGKVYFDLIGAPATLKNISFLENLVRIRGQKFKGGPTGDSTALTVMRHDNLEFLGLRNLKALESGNVIIGMLPNLCYAETMNWKSLFHLPTQSNYIQKVKPKDDCDKNGLVCHSQCNDRGCWGPGPTMCLECRGLKAGKSCVQFCKDIPGFFRNGTQCAPCHSECLKGCIGPKANQCEGGCKNVLEMGECKAKCSRTFFVKTKKDQKECVPCNIQCFVSQLPQQSVCTGPSDKAGPGGCRYCSRVIAGVDGLRCLSNEKSCPQGHFAEYLQIDNPDAKKFVDPSQGGLQMCKKCHPLCAACNALDTRSGRCLNCTGVWLKGDCIKSCPKAETYDIVDPTNTKTPTVILPYDVQSGENATPTYPGKYCLPCSNLCRKGCTGPTRGDCTSCRYFKIYTKKPKFECNSTCPDNRKNEEPEPGTGDFLCLFDHEVAATRQRRKMQTIYAVVFGLLGLLCLAAIILAVWCLRKRAENERAKEELKAIYSNIKEPDTKQQSMFSREPNLGRLEMINQDDLIFDPKSVPLGSGAFGAVYKGIWQVPKHARAGMGGKIATLEVAIKVISDTTNSKASTEELMDEAKVMASVSHKHCLRLIGVCLSLERRCLVSAFVELGSMDRYLRQYGRDLTSLHLLTWAEQIADGMAYLEMRGIIHRDLATRNVLVNSPELVQITDFGLAKMLEGDDEREVIVKAGRVPIRWLAIETLQHGVYSHQTDVWAYGVTLWEIFTYGRRPYDNVDTVDIKDHVLKGARLPQPDICTLDVYMVMVKCWMEDPDTRPTFMEMMKIFSSFNQNPGRYLFIPGDKYALQQPPSGNEVEMRPLLPNNLGRNSSRLDSDICGARSNDLPTRTGQSPRGRMTRDPHSPGAEAFRPLLTSVDSQRYGPDPCADLPPPPPPPPVMQPVPVEDGYLEPSLDPSSTNYADMMDPEYLDTPTYPGAAIKPKNTVVNPIYQNSPFPDDGDYLQPTLPSQNSRV